MCIRDSPGPGDETTVGDVSPGPIANAVPEGSSAPAPMSPAIASAWQRFIMCSLFFILFSLCKIKGDVQPSAVTSPYIMICFPVRMVRQPGPSVRPASKLLEELPEGLLLSLIHIFWDPGFWTPGFCSPDFWNPDFWTPGFWTPDFWSPGIPEPCFPACPEIPCSWKMYYPVCSPACSGVLRFWTDRSPACSGTCLLYTSSFLTFL